MAGKDTFAERILRDPYDALAELRARVQASNESDLADRFAWTVLRTFERKQAGHIRCHEDQPT